MLIFIILSYLFVLNVIACYFCYIDKRRAVKHQRRIPEKKLCMVSFLGGAFGFFISMYLFHHKTRHVKFLILEPIFMIFWGLFIYYVWRYV